MNDCRVPTVERFGKPVAGSVPTIIRSFEATVTHRINEMRGLPGARMRQRHYYEHVIRDEDEFRQIGYTFSRILGGGGEKSYSTKRIY